MHAKHSLLLLPLSTRTLNFRDCFFCFLLLSAATGRIELVTTQIRRWYESYLRFVGPLANGPLGSSTRSPILGLGGCVESPMLGEIWLENVFI